MKPHTHSRTNLSFLWSIRVYSPWKNAVNLFNLYNNIEYLLANLIKNQRKVVQTCEFMRSQFLQIIHCIATLRIIVEQKTLDWNSSVYYEKAFDSVDRETLWKLLKHYGIPEKIITLIQRTYEGMSCRVVHRGQLSDCINVRTGVHQGCLLSPFMFLLVIDWIMRTTTKG